MKRTSLSFSLIGQPYFHDEKLPNRLSRIVSIVLSHYYNLVRGPSLVLPQIAPRHRHLDHKDGTTVGHVKAIEWNNWAHKVFFNHKFFLTEIVAGVFKWLGAVQDKAWSGCLRSSGPPTLGCLGIRRHLLAAAFLRWLHNNFCCTLLCPSPSFPQNYLYKLDQRQNECKTTRVRPVESFLTLEKTDLDGDYVVSLHTLVYKQPCSIRNEQTV